MEISELTYTAHDRRILHGFSARFPDGQITALIGPNGAGKTTLLRCLSGELTTTGGTVNIDGRAVDTSSDDWKTVIGVVPDSDALFEELTVGEQLSLAATLFGIRDPELTIRVQSLLSLSNLTEREDSLGSELSAGMRKRLAVALALVHAPRILLFDEPLNTMDYSSSETFFRLLQYLRSAGRTVLISGHSLPALIRVSDCIVEVDKGKAVNSVQLPDGPRPVEQIASMLKTAAGRQEEIGQADIALGWMEQ